MNKILRITLCCMTMFVFVACQSSKADEDVAITLQMPNPVVAYETAEDAIAAVDFDAKLISNLPTGYEFSSAAVIDKTLVQIDFTNGDSKISYRTAKTSDDITGAYIEFPDEKLITINSTGITIFSTGDQVDIAKWNTDGIAYSFYFTYAEGAMLDVDAIKAMISSVAG